MEKQQRAHACIDDALRLDASNRNQEAYVQYLRSISAVATSLLDDAQQRVFPGPQNPQGMKLLNLAKQCLERAQELGQTLGAVPGSSSTSTCNVASELQQAQRLPKMQSVPLPDLLPSQPSNVTPVVPAAAYPDCHSQQSLMDVSVSFLDSMPSESLDAFSTKAGEPTPLELVNRENQQLMVAFQARLARTHATTARINLKLALERRLVENVVLARAKQQVLERRQREQHQRLLEQAARKVVNAGQRNSKDEEFQKQLYARILEYEEEEKWPQSIKEKLKVNPKDFALMDFTVRKTLSIPGHPLCKLLQQLQYSVYDKVAPLLSRERLNLSELDNVHIGNARDTNRLACLRDTGKSELGSHVDLSSTGKRTVAEKLDNNDITLYCAIAQASFDHRKDGGTQLKVDVERMEEDALRRHLDNIVIDLRGALDKLLRMLMLTYEQLSSPDGCDQCHASIEEPFFKPIWSYLRELFRMVFHAEEATMEKVMKQMANTTIQQLDVSREHWGDVDHPYQEAIIEMGNIVNHVCPLKKLEALVQVARIICEDTHGSSKVMGADDLIPIMCFVMLKTNMPQLISECHAMEQFIHEGYLMGEEGYCLTSMQTAIHYLLSLGNVD